MKKIMRILGVCIATFVLAIVCGILFFESPTKDVAQAESIECALKTKYVYGESIEISTAKIIYEGEELEASCKYVCLPDNRATNKTSLVLNQVGKYEVCYVAEKDGLEIVEQFTFDVIGELFSVSNSNSSVSYGTHPYTPNKEGLMVTLAKGDVFTYNRAIDVTNITEFEDIFKFYVTPNNIGVCDATQIRIRLTDAYDENNYVE